jgi:hypothetical protein
MKEGTVPIEVRVDVRVAATIHRWVEQRMPGCPVSTALKIGLATLEGMFKKEERFETYGEATAYLAARMKRLNRRNTSGISESLQRCLEAEGAYDQVLPTGQIIPLRKDGKEEGRMTQEEMMAAGKAFMERERLKRVIEGKEPLQTTSDESTPISAEEFAQMEADKKERTRLAFMASLKGGTAPDATTDD